MLIYQRVSEKHRKTIESDVLGGGFSLGNALSSFAQGFWGSERPEKPRGSAVRQGTGTMPLEGAGSANKKTETDWWFGTMEFYNCPFSWECHPNCPWFGVSEHEFYCSISWECHHPNWRTPWFFRGVGITTNQEKLDTWIWGKHDRTTILAHLSIFLGACGPGLLCCPPAFGRGYTSTRSPWMIWRIYTAMAKYGKLSDPTIHKEMWCSPLPQIFSHKPKLCSPLPKILSQFGPSANEPSLFKGNPVGNNPASHKTFFQTTVSC